MKIKLKTRYRIVTDRFAGYEVQIWRPWWPFWVEHRINTFHTVQGARDYITRIRHFVVEIVE